MRRVFTALPGGRWTDAEEVLVPCGRSEKRQCSQVRKQRLMVRTLSFSSTHSTTLAVVLLTQCELYEESMGPGVRHTQVVQSLLFHLPGLRA